MVTNVACEFPVSHFHEHVKCPPLLLGLNQLQCNYCPLFRQPNPSHRFANHGMLYIRLPRIPNAHSP